MRSETKYEHPQNVYLTKVSVDCHVKRLCKARHNPSRQIIKLNDTLQDLGAGVVFGRLAKQQQAVAAAAAASAEGKDDDESDAEPPPAAAKGEAASCRHLFEICVYAVPALRQVLT